MRLTLAAAGRAPRRPLDPLFGLHLTDFLGIPYADDDPPPEPPPMRLYDAANRLAARRRALDEDAGALNEATGYLAQPPRLARLTPAYLAPILRSLDRQAEELRAMVGRCTDEATRYDVLQDLEALYTAAELIRPYAQAEPAQ